MTHKLLQKLVERTIKKIDYNRLTGELKITLDNPQGKIIIDFIMETPEMSIQNGAGKVVGITICDVCCDLVTQEKYGRTGGLCQTCYDFYSNIEVENSKARR